MQDAGFDLERLYDTAYVASREHHARSTMGMLEMSPELSTGSDPVSLVIYVGQDCTGHWLVQDSAKRIEGRFVSRAAALSFATAEREMYHARLAFASTPLVPMISFVSAGAHEYALPRAA